MIRYSMSLLSCALMLAVLAACAEESPAPSLPGLEIRFEGVNGGQAPCQIRRVARVDQDRHSLYMVRGEGRYRLSDGQTRNIPVQIQFRSIEGVVTDEAITLTDFEVSCDQVTVDWTIEYCQNQDRDRVECPPFEVQWQGQIGEFDLEFESP